MGTTAIKEENTFITDSDSVHAEGAVEANENFHQKETLQSLFSLLREEVEQMDSKILPLCLHQVLPMIMGCCNFVFIRDLYSLGKNALIQYMQIFISGQGILMYNRWSWQISSLRSSNIS